MSNVELDYRRRLLKSLVYQYNFRDFGYGQSAKTTHIDPIGH
jgi:hypothetical protein